MWRRVYLLLLIVRIYFAFSPSYLHPDEIFQGPEVVAGLLFPYPSVRTWEWTVANPIRSVFPLWPFYGLPMALLKAVWAKETDELVSPAIIYYTLRAVMFILTFVLEDWAIYELVHSPKRRQGAVILVASSYVTWTFQTHTFSNSVETLLVLWCLVLMERIAKANTHKLASKADPDDHNIQRRSSVASSALLGFLLVLGLFNRITFPAFVLIPGMQLLPHFRNRLGSFCALLTSVGFWIVVAVATDTAFYVGPAATRSFRDLYEYVRHTPVITPLNNLLYNTQISNLAHHGIHPRYQHILVNLPQLLGPAIFLLLFATPFHDFKALLRNTRLTSAATGTLILSIIPHQEPRFLIPCIPLLLTCFSLPNNLKLRRWAWITWAVFNGAMSILMGVYHQGGVIPAQLAVPLLITNSLNSTRSEAVNIEIFWWKTYPPPTYLLGAAIENPVSRSSRPLNIDSIPLHGLKQADLASRVSEQLPSCAPPSMLNKVAEVVLPSTQTDVFLAAPLSAWRFDANVSPPPVSNFTFNLPLDSDDSGSKDGQEHFKLVPLATFHKHINLDDLDFGDDGIWPTLSRVIGRRGLAVWRVERVCPDSEASRRSGSWI